MMIMKRGQPQKDHTVPMTLDLREKVERRAAAVEASLQIRGSQDLGGRAYQRELGNKDDAIQRLRNLKKILRQDDMRRELSVGERSALWREADRLRSEFQVGMPTKSEMHPAHVNLQTQKPYLDEQRVNMSVQKNLAWLKKNQSKTLEFKRIMRILAPDRPELANIEYHRPTGQQTSKAIIVGG